MADETPASLLLQRAHILARYSEEAGLLVRRSFTEQLSQVHEVVAAWMREAGMVVQRDAIGNLIGRYEASDARARTLLLGSHLDSVRDAGRYDGPLGVLAALAAVDALERSGQRLPYAIEVIAFQDEEGLRFHTSYLGSSAVAGTFRPEWLRQADESGVTLQEAIALFGGDPMALERCRRPAEELLGYCEVHIEQGPVLETADLPVGVVSAIAGQSRFTVTFTGLAGHAGTVPMALRHDALCAAAVFILAVERKARDREGLVATVGQIAAGPGASNVIPGQVTLSLDVRHQDDAVREAACRELGEVAGEIARERAMEMRWQAVQETPAVQCSPTLVSLLSDAVSLAGYQVLQLPSGAGHDAVALSHLTQVAMLFVRCAGGISHNPEESVREDDVAVAIQVLGTALERLGHGYSRLLQP